MADRIPVLLLALLIDLIFGDPERFPHPVRYIGRFISFMEHRLRGLGLNLRFMAPVLTLSTVALSMGLVAIALACLSLMGRWPSIIGQALICWTGISARCLAKEAMGVFDKLFKGLALARRQLARIVGRDTEQLSQDEIISATVETVAENTTDGIISPIFYALLGGPVLMMGFKAVSTLDSMVGYMNDEYRDIGWSSARLDDLLNWLPARLTGLIMCFAAPLAGLDGRRAFFIMCRDHSKHKSPNCAYSEAAAAGALGIQLGGAHAYKGVLVEKPTIGEPLRPPVLDDIRAAVRLMYLSTFIFVAIILLGGCLWKLMF